MATIETFFALVAESQTCSVVASLRTLATLGAAVAWVSRLPASQPIYVLNLYMASRIQDIFLNIFHIVYP